MLLDVPLGKFGFTKGCIIAVIWLSLSRTLNVANLTLIVLSFGSQLHSFWRWTCVCVMLLRKMPFKQIC
ncbi:DUF645 family protein [Vibrio cholerae]|uniref:DUF645 family protein n=1 Tax=Vibrio cholerae TaxID=666 RepID=UPI00158A9DBA|nr:DUF645 family protein [Vibrio cholerae]EJL6758986.1 DUF645 family protein [Vibrio cholerae]EKF9746119.1 DUF645 family protein [Vibrio cholerae]EKO4195269.1 DUF645 family protein [Vibrio cholerae]ELH0844971.1 DUF645 family protein [Vibrio cholerae]